MKKKEKLKIVSQMDQDISINTIKNIDLNKFIGGLTHDEITDIINRKLKKGETKRTSPVTGQSVIMKDDGLQTEPKLPPKE